MIAQRGPEGWDIDTPEGMQNAIYWMENIHLPTLKDVSTWAVPRSLTAYELDKPNRVATRLIGDGDSSIERVFRQMGWTVTTA